MSFFVKDGYAFGRNWLCQWKCMRGGIAPHQIVGWAASEMSASGRTAERVQGERNFLALVTCRCKEVYILVTTIETISRLPILG